MLGRISPILILIAAGAGCRTTTTQSYEFQIPESQNNTVLDTRLRQLEKLAKEYPKRSDLHYQMAGVYYQKEDFKGSAKSLQRAIYIDPNEAKYHYHLGRIYLRMRELDEAEKSFRRCLELTASDRYTGAHGALGYVLCQQGKWDAARKEFETCLRIDPRDPNSYYFLGCIDDMQGRREQAIENLKEYLARGGRNFRTKTVQILSSYGVAVPEAEPRNALIDDGSSDEKEGEDAPLGDFPARQP